MTDARFVIDQTALAALAEGPELRAALVRANGGEATERAAMDRLIVGPFSPWPWAPEFHVCARHGEHQVSFLVDGIVRWQPKCLACLADSKVRQALGRSGIPPRFLTLTLETYQALLPGERAALAAAVDYLRAWDGRGAKGHCMAFTGRFGTGKTHLACGIGLGLIARGVSVAHFTTLDLVRRWRESWAVDATQSEAQVLRAFVEVDFLILEEVGRQRDSESERGHLFEVLDGRYGRNKPTLITSNYPLRGGKKTVEAFLGQAAFDRLYRNGFTHVTFDWESFTTRGHS